MALTMLYLAPGGTYEWPRQEVNDRDESAGQFRKKNIRGNLSGSQ